MTFPTTLSASVNIGPPPGAARDFDLLVHWTGGVDHAWWDHEVGAWAYNEPWGDRRHFPDGAIKGWIDLSKLSTGLVRALRGAS